MMYKLAEDGVGNKQVYTLNVTNVDQTPPVIEIAVSPENTVGIEAQVTIDFGDSTVKKYRIGNSGNFVNYTGAITLNSNNIIANGQANTDKTVTVYAQGTDSVGNSVTVNKKILSLDLDAPSAPVINSNYGYPVLTEYGIQFDGATTIAYDSRTDITNYYSTNGTDWNVYTGTFNYAQSGTIYAKSVKNGTGLTVSSQKAVSMPSDAMPPAVYDGNNSTGANKINGRKIAIDESMIGKKVRECKIYNNESRC